MFIILDYSSALEYSIIRRYTNIIYYYYYYEAKIISIKKLKHKFSSGSDSISKHLIKCAPTTISKHLMVIINQMITNGICPEKLTLAKVIPVFKSGDDQLISNYRPISLLSSISKIFEYVIQDQLVDYLLVNNLLCNEQFGFRSGYSTELCKHLKVIMLYNNL